MHFRPRCAGWIALALVISVGGSAVAMQPAAEPQGAPKTAPESQAKKAGNKITDGWITMKIHAQFVPENALEDSDIDVDTNGGVVTLSGTVANEAGRARAIAIVKATDGVKSVTDKLRVAPEGTAGAAAGAAKATGRKVTDGWITSKIYAQFLTESALDDSDIDVDVTKGAVTLTGTVRSEAGRQRAVAVAKATDGVKTVKDSLKVAGTSK
jgi:hyperosmotically inducible periplasmic protein